MPKSPSLTRRTIAAEAARLMAEDGTLDYADAKRIASKPFARSGQRVDLPDNEEIEDELRTYQGLFQGDEQRVHVRDLRETALDVMCAVEAALPESRPHLSGAVFKGTAGPGAEIELAVFVDDPKRVEFWLLNRQMRYGTTERTHFNRQRRGTVPLLTFEWRDEIVNLAVYDGDDLRSTAHAERASTSELRALMDAERSLS